MYIYVDARDFGPDKHRYLTKFQGRAELQYVNSETANKKYPQLVIDYFEELRSWTSFKQRAVAEAQRNVWRERLRTQNETNEK